MTTREHRVERMEALLSIGRYADAEVSIRSELALAPDSAELHHLLARALVCQDRAPAALEHARIAAALEPESPDILHLYAGTLAEVGDGQQAYAVAVRAVRLAPDEWRSHVAVAHALTFGVRGLPALRAAETAAHRAVTLAPTEPDTHVLYGIVRWRLDDFTVAEEAFRNALAIDPQHADAQRNLASLQLDRVELQAGADTLARGLSAHPQDRGMHDELARAHMRLLGTATSWFVLSALLLGGFMLATDFLLRQRAFDGFVMLLMICLYVAKVLRRLPAGSWRRLLPWHSAPSGAAHAWRVWGMAALAGLVWFAPAGVAAPAWVVLAVAAGLAIGTFLFKVMLGAAEVRRDNVSRSHD